MELCFRLADRTLFWVWVFDLLDFHTISVLLVLSGRSQSSSRLSQQSPPQGCQSVLLSDAFVYLSVCCCMLLGKHFWNCIFTLTTLVAKQLMSPSMGCPLLQVRSYCSENADFFSMEELGAVLKAGQVTFARQMRDWNILKYSKLNASVGVSFSRSCLPTVPAFMGRLGTETRQALTTLARKMWAADDRVTGSMSMILNKDLQIFATYSQVLSQSPEHKSSSTKLVKNREELWHFNKTDFWSGFGPQFLLEPAWV